MLFKKITAVIFSCLLVCMVGTLSSVSANYKPCAVGRAVSVACKDDMVNFILTKLLNRIAVSRMLGMKVGYRTIELCSRVLDCSKSELVSYFEDINDEDILFDDLLNLSERVAPLLIEL